MKNCRKERKGTQKGEAMVPAVAAEKSVFFFASLCVPCGHPH
jgi:hypothetical protein